MEKKIAGILLIFLALSLEFNSILLTRLVRVSAQPEELAKKLEDYLGKAIPEELLAEECEYVVPQGFDNAFAERLWRDMSFYVSAGHTTEELRSELRKTYGNSSLVNATLSNGEMMVLNLSGIAVERNMHDGSVAIRIPVVSESNLSYVKYNFTEAAGFYEVLNKTLVRKYRVWRREPGVYIYTMSFLETNRDARVVSRICGFETEGSIHSVKRVKWTSETGEIPIISYGSGILWESVIIAIPGRYEDVRVVVPQQEVNYRVLFPAYDPVAEDDGEGWGWVVYTNISSTSLSVGETLVIHYSASYEPPQPMGLLPCEEEPLNATLTLNAPEAFEPLNSLERRLNDTHRSGVFSLKAVKPGTYNLTLTLAGNAYFNTFPGYEETYTVQVVSPPAPSLNVEIVGVDTSILKHAKLRLRLSNNGGGAARLVNVEITGNNIQGVSEDIGDVEAGETRVEEFTLRVLGTWSIMRIVVKYSDDGGNPYVVVVQTPYDKPIEFRNYWVPEHYETYTAIVPEHEETMRVFVPGYEGATHVRLYAISLSTVDLALLYMQKGWSYEVMERLLYGGVPALELDSIPIPGLGAEFLFEEGEEALREAGVKIMVKSIEPYYEYIGILEEDEALRLINTSNELLRNGNVSSDFRVEPLNPYWVKEKPVVLNSTEFALYQATMEGLKKTNPDLDYESKETIADVRTRVGEAEQGYVVLIYRPLKVVGEGPLKSVRLRNFAAIGFEYRVDVETSQLTFFGKTPGDSAWETLYLSGKEDAVLLSSSLDARDQEVNVSLTYNGKLVAKASFRLEPESSIFWRGFWDGFKGELWRIVLTGVVMVVLCVAGGGTVGAMALKLSVLAFLSTMILINAVTQYVELGQVLSTAFTLKEVGNSLRDEASRFSNLGYRGTAGMLSGAADEIACIAWSIQVNFSSILDFIARVSTDLSLWEWEVLLGLREAEPYENGRVWGKVTGIAISLLEFLAGFCYLAAGGATSASLGAKAKAVLQGLYNWLTPAMTDAISVVRSMPKIAKGYGMLVSVISRMKELGTPIIEVLKMDAEGAINLAGIFGKILDAAKEKEISDEAVQAIKEICARATELGEEAAKSLAGSIDTLLSKNTEFTDEFATWAKEANPSMEWVVETTGKLAELSEEELGNLGDAFSKIEADKEKGFENGFKLFNTYLGMSKKYAGQQVEAFRNAFLKDVKSYGVEALDAWGSAVEKNGFAARASEEGTPYPFIHAEVYKALGEPKEGAWFTVVTRLNGREIRVATELAAKQVEGYTVHRLAPAREGSFTVLEAGRFVEVYPGWNDINLIIKTGIGEGGEIKYTIRDPDVNYIRSVGEGVYEIAYWRLGEPSVEHHRVRGLYSSTSAICFPSDGEGTYVIRLVRKIDEAFLLSLYNGPGQLSYSGGKYFLNLYGVTLTGESKYSHGIAGGMGGVEIEFPFFSEGEHAESLAVVSTVNDQGAWSSRIGYGSGREGWRYVYSMPPPSDENGYRVFKIFFGENEPEGATYVKYDPSTGEFSSYRISRDSIVFKETLGNIIGDKYFFAKETDTVSGAARWVPTRNLQEYGDAVGVIRSLSGINPKYDEGVAGHMIAAQFVKENKEVFGIGQEVEVLEGKNLFIDEVGNNWEEPLDVRVMDPSNPKRIIAALEVKLITSSEESLSSRLGGEDLRGELYKRLEDAKMDYELPENIYVLAIKITMEKIEFAWRKHGVAEIPNGGYEGEG